MFDVAGKPSHRCSASLLTPTVVLTAGHCTDGTSAACIWFDEDAQSNPEYPFSGTTSHDGVAYTYPGFCIGCGNGLPGFAAGDVGIIVLSEPVPTSVASEYVELPDEGLVDTLKNKTAVDFVGYGVQEQNRGGVRSRAACTGETGSANANSMTMSTKNLDRNRIFIS